MTTKFASLTLGAALAASSIFAQDQPAPAPVPIAAPAAAPAHHIADPNKQLKNLTRKLALTGDQQNQILPILTDRQQQMAGIESDATLSQKDRHQRIKDLRISSDSKLRTVLTDTQRQAYDQMLQDNRERAQAHRRTTVNPN